MTEAPGTVRTVAEVLAIARRAMGGILTAEGPRPRRRAEDADELFARIRSDLQDLVAESTFAGAGSAAETGARRDDTVSRSPGCRCPSGLHGGLP